MSAEKIQPTIRELLKGLAEETGLSPAYYVSELLKARNASEEYILRLITRGRKNFNVVISIDRFEYPRSELFEKRFSTPEKARDFALRKTIEAAMNASAANVATVYYAYGPQPLTINEKGELWGIRYLGGDAWKECPEKIHPFR